MKGGLLVFLLCCTGFFARAQDLDSLKKLLKTKLHDTTRLQVLGKLVELEGEDTWKAYNVKLKALSQKRKAESKKGTRLYRIYSAYYADGLYNDGVAFYDSSDFRQALACQQKALAIFQEINNKNGETDALLEIAKIYTLTGAHKKAISTYYEVLRIYMDLKKKDGMADCYLGVGNIQAPIAETEDAIVNFQKALILYDKLKDYEGVALCCANISTCYVTLEKFDSSHVYLEKARQVENKLTAHGKAFIRMHEGILYRELKQTDKAIGNYHQALETFEEEGEYVMICTMQRLLGRIYYEQTTDYHTALDYTLDALELSREIKFADEIERTTRQAYLIYKALKQYDKALVYLEAYENLLNQRSTIEIENTIFQEQLNYEFEKKQLLAKARNEKRISHLKLDAERKNFRKNVWITITLFICFIAVLLIFFSYRNARQKSIIAGQKNNILKQKLLVSQMNPHFIFNSLNAIQNCIFKQDGLKAGTYLAQFAELMRMILEFSRKDLVPLESEVHMLHNYFQLQQFRFDGKFDYEIQVDPRLIASKTGIPPMLAQPFIENSIEHGIFFKEEPGFIRVKIVRRDDNILYEITDNGVGIEGGKKFKRNTTGTHNSLATIITQERIDALFLSKNRESQIKITDLCTEDQTLSGVRVSFEIPYQEL